MNTQPTETRIRIGEYVLYLRAKAEKYGAKRSRKRMSERSQIPLPTEQKEQNDDSKKEKQAEHEKPEEKLEDMVEKTQNVLLQARAVAPFDMFPDIIIIDRKKITLNHRSFFGVKQTVSVRHTDVTNVQADVGPFLGSLTITSEHFINNIQTIKYLHRKDAIAIQQLIQGMIIAHKEGVEMNDIDDKKLLELLNGLGESESLDRKSLT